MTHLGLRELSHLEIAMTKLGTSRLKGSTIACLIFVATIPACTKQTGKFVVSNRKAIQLPGNSGSMDVLFGLESRSTKNSQAPLLIIIAYDPTNSCTKVQRTGGDGAMVSTINVSHYEDSRTCFHYGCIWNRTSDEVGVNSSSFDRSNGSAFLLVPMNNAVVVFQLPGINATGQISTESILGEVSNQISSQPEIPLHVRQYFSQLEKRSD
jgi:hypothetical protein